MTDQDPNALALTVTGMIVDDTYEFSAPRFFDFIKDESARPSSELPFFCSTRFPLQIRAGSGSSNLLESGNADEGSELKVDVHVVSSFLCVRGWIFTECGNELEGEIAMLSLIISVTAYIFRRIVLNFRRY
ncbi:hypothetical protein ACFX2G_039308 [Malus domestica]